METERLIHTLAGRIEPVRPLRPPRQRAAVWAAAGAAYLLLLLAAGSPVVDLSARLLDTGFLWEQAAALLTGVVAGAGALASSVPGFNRRWLWLPLAAAAVWIAIVTARAMADVRAGGLLLNLGSDWGCAATVIVGGLVPAALMATMLRRGAPTAPHLTAALGGLAAAGLGNVGACLFHPHSSNVVVLLWHVGTVLLLAACAGALGGRLLRWPAPERALAS